VRITLSYTNALAPGDVRQLGRGDHITLDETVRERANWHSISIALGTALYRGADIVWQDAATRELFKWKKEDA
jgi:hypothetical protein